MLYHTVVGTVARCTIISRLLWPVSRKMWGFEHRNSVRMTCGRVVRAELLGGFCKSTGCVACSKSPHKVSASSPCSTIGQGRIHTVGNISHYQKTQRTFLSLHTIRTIRNKAREQAKVTRHIVSQTRAIALEDHSGPGVAVQVQCTIRAGGRNGGNSLLCICLLGKEDST
ncbi:hypothetical protein BD289DRAFT_437685 [Coniella lustricola]|uniref:Uncharacterized protein n=1 Tax=Coniella lustricola TaxID=2025994 RepID=A0A2T3A3U1_9PEZI|nr:hypothetical protein BD289DRAFT_437685 [Coniella lustricola]